MTTAIRKTVHLALSGAILHLNHAHKICVKAGMTDVADCVEAAVGAIEQADHYLKRGSDRATVVA